MPLEKLVSNCSSSAYEPDDLGQITSIPRPAGNDSSSLSDGIVARVSGEHQCMEDAYSGLAHNGLPASTGFY